jgi:peptidoglycan/LPS O-acetylase OafA/YrhL
MEENTGKKGKRHAQSLKALDRFGSSTMKIGPAAFVPEFLCVSPSPAKPLPSDKPKGHRILELDGLRGIAILLVITKHYGAARLLGETQSIAAAFFHRFYPALSGVDLFFVLTGFLLGGRLLAAVDSPHYYSTFYLRRCCRTFPPYYLLLLSFAVAVLTGNALRSATGLDLAWPFDTPWSLVAYALFLQNFFIAAAASLGPSWLMITWSLAVQEQFYLLLPWLLRCGLGRGLGYVLVGLFLMAPLCRLTVVYFLPSEQWNGYDGLLCCRTDTLGVGVLAAWLLQATGVREWLTHARVLLCPAATILFLGFSFLVYSGYGMGTPGFFVFGHTFVAVLYLMVVLIACFASQGLMGALLRMAVLRELGRVSYGLYLYHSMVRDLFFGLLFGTSAWLDGWETWVATVEAFLLTVLLAELSWRFLEKPLIAWSKAPCGTNQIGDPASREAVRLAVP